jgi:DNA polymerase I
MQNGLLVITPELMAEEKNFFILDAYALIFRAYYAFITSSFKNSKGFDTSTIFGFVNALDEIIKNQKPTHIAVAFDPAGPTFRNDLYPAYKANREATPENIKNSIPVIKEILNAYNIPMFLVPGFEADDVIGTVAKIAEKQGFTVYMMTPDKDFTQLLSENIHIYKPKKSGNDAEILKVQDVCALFDVQSPSQIIDILALWGDASDNVPGVPGIGEKTAKNLISRFNNLEGVYDNLHELKGKLRENLEMFKDQALLSRELVTINTNVPLIFNPDYVKYSEPDREKLLEIFKELEFRSLIQKYSTSSTQANYKPPQPSQGSLFDNPAVSVEISSPISSDNIHTVAKEYILLDSEALIDSFIREFSSKSELCFDTETTALDTNQAELVALSFSNEVHKAYYLPIPPDFEEAVKILHPFKQILEDESILKIGQNLKFDIKMLYSYGISVKGPLFDTMIAHYLLEPEQRHNLNDLSLKYLNYSTVPIEDLIGVKGRNQGNMRNVAIEKIKDYACEDADVTYQLYLRLLNELKINNLYDLAVSIEMPLIYVISMMEAHGVKLNTGSLKEFSIELIKLIEASEKSIFQLAGTDFNISSPKQLGDILFVRLKIAGDNKMTKTRQFSTDEETLSKLHEKHPIIQEVLNYRSLRKLHNTYVDALPKLIDKKTGKLHTSYNQTVTATGRLSSNNPNLQNIPIREERGREIRKAFIPSNPDMFILSADYSQIELRLMAHMSKDENLIKAFLASEDIHTSTAALINNIPPEEVSREMRNKAKTANFGIIYGISSFGLSQRLKISRTEAKELIDGYFQSYPGVKNYMEECIRLARETGYVTTLMGRKRALPDILSRNATVRGFAERNAINSPIQGTAADIIKLAMINIHKELIERKLNSKMILQVHDELVFDVVKEEIDMLKEIVKLKMESAITLDVPLVVEIGVGLNWLEAH